MARVNVDILGISELKWTGMGEFNSDDHYIYYCGRNPSEETVGRKVPSSLPTGHGALSPREVTALGVGGLRQALPHSRRAAVHGVAKN